jgi:hypothetical protein
VACPLLAFAAREELGYVGRDIALQQVGGMQLAQQLDHFILGRRVLVEPPVGDLPQLRDGAPAVHQGDDQTRRGRESVNAGGGRILQQIP